MALSGKQQGVLRGIAAALAIIALAALTAAILAERGPILADDLESRLSFGALWICVAALWLIASIGNMARHRFFSPADIDGGAAPESGEGVTVRAHRSILQNTLEQTVLAIVAYAAWAVAAPFAWLVALPFAAGLFCIGRLLFWRGYKRGAPGRALGFALTFYPTVLLFLLLGLHAAMSFSQ
jgi:uncharacterized membrane protein YecN with MAPEG domain